MTADATTAMVMLPLSYWFLNQTFNSLASEVLWWLPLAAAAITIGCFYFFGLYRTILRFSDPRFFVQVIISSAIVASLVASVAFAVSYGYDNPATANGLGFPRRTFIMFALTLGIGSSTSRLTARWYFERMSRKYRTGVIVYGAGECGHKSFYALRHGTQYSVVAFVDDNTDQQGKNIHGLRVFSPTAIKSIIANKNAKVVLLAMPSIDHGKRSEIIKNLEQLKITVKTTPKLSEIISGKSSTGEIRNLPIEDLLNRTPVGANEELAGYCVANKSVLVTGAGGSIGSELCRQILNRRPTTIVLYEMTESSLFYIEQELLNRVAKENPSTNIVPVLGSVLDQTRLKETMLRYSVSSVFHAAAYKHVPMVESNPIEGVRNNVLGTKRVTEAAIWTNVESLVVVSTDKAVRPTNLMGATKRFAELVVQSLVSENQTMKTCMVRFGNVLGSSGSVIPTFQDQIKCGGPVTVTHKDMTRYFMTIPEASQLVLQAGAMGNNGEVFVLDMGEPKSIYKLAKELICLSGLQVLDTENPAGDIEIKFVGLRPGEKMHEELSMTGCLESTTHHKINRSQEVCCVAHQVQNTVTLIEEAILNYDENEVVRLICTGVPEYSPSKEMCCERPEVVVKQRVESKKIIPSDTLTA
jgi:FlaA1/EpsC-like NDP-sugar epimerase